MWIGKIVLARKFFMKKIKIEKNEGGVALEGFDLGIGNKYWNCCGPDRHRSKHPLQYSERQKTLQ